MSEPEKVNESPTFKVGLAAIKNTWEYKTVCVDISIERKVTTDHLDSILNGYGSMGWECFAHFSVNQNFVLFFKRPLTTV